MVQSHHAEPRRQASTLPLGVPSGRSPTPLLTVKARRVLSTPMTERTTTAFATATKQAPRPPSVLSPVASRTYQPVASASLMGISGQSNLRVIAARPMRSYPAGSSHPHSGETRLQVLPTVQAKRSP
jgi:hypothetical protein